MVLLLGRRPSNHPALPDQEQVSAKAEIVRSCLHYYFVEEMEEKSLRLWH